jgi:hypothetical protein
MVVEKSEPRLSEKAGIDNGFENCRTSSANGLGRCVRDGSFGPASISLARAASVVNPLWLESGILPALLMPHSQAASRPGVSRRTIGSIKSHSHRPTHRDEANPHFSPVACCNGGYARGDCVALGRSPRRIVKYACGGLGRAPCLRAVSAVSRRQPMRKAGWHRASARGRRQDATTTWRQQVNNE